MNIEGTRDMRVQLKMFPVVIMKNPPDDHIGNSDMIGDSPHTSNGFTGGFSGRRKREKAPRIHAPTFLKVDRTTRKNIRLEVLAVNVTISIGQQAVQGYSFARHRVRLPEAHPKFLRIPFPVNRANIKTSIVSRVTGGLPSLLPSFRLTKLEIKKHKKFILVNVNTKCNSVSSSNTRKIHGGKCPYQNAIAAAVPTQEKFIEESVHIEVQKKYISAVPTDSSSFQQALTDSWSRTAVYVSKGEKQEKRCLEHPNLGETLA
ncbi:hypothetical protein TNCV_3163371 [Trichonephila clavipes]|nr:hypothetical protein TNCV_3163371 [Trichonephila clavipes]